MSLTSTRVLVPVSTMCDGGVLTRSPTRPTGPKSSRRLRALATSPRLTVNLDRAVGCGGHASVVPGKVGDKRVAVKVLPVCDPQTANELAAARAIGSGHANVVRTETPVASPDNKHMYLPMEMCDGDLLAYTDAREGLDEAAARSLFPQILAGVAFLHSRGVYHLDLKPENVLMKGGVPKVADFGTADVTGSSCGARTTLAPCGTLIYACPESVALADASCPRAPSPAPASPRPPPSTKSRSRARTC